MVVISININRMENLMRLGFIITVKIYKKRRGQKGA